jgi:hypothetical protein
MIRAFIPGDQALVFPEGTVTAHIVPTWAMYTNRRLNVTWIGYAVKGGTQILKLAGIRKRGSADFRGIQSYVRQIQATACGECEG